MPGKNKRINGRKKRSAKTRSAKRAVRRASIRSFFPPQIGRFAKPYIPSQVARFAQRVRSEQEEKKLLQAFHAEIPCWSIDDEIALRTTTFLLNYKDGNRLKVNVRLQFHHTTWTRGFIVFDRMRLFRELVAVIRDSKPDVEQELLYRGDSELFYDCTSYSHGEGTMPVLIEILYVS